MKNVRIKKGFRNPEKPGLYHRLLCLTGEDKGDSYYLNGQRILMGRGKNVDIAISDSGSSKTHAELSKLKGKYFLTDLGSLNGVFVNNKKTIQKYLDDGDLLVIGKTVYRYNVIDVGKPQEIFKEEKKQEDSSKDEKVEVKKRINPKILLIVGLIAIFLFWDPLKEDDSDKKKKTQVVRSTLETEKEITSIFKKKPTKADKELKDKLVGAIHRGLREYREKNYFRAIQEFNMALILEPNHARASFYLNKTKKSLDDEISLMLLRARRDTDALKFQGAIVSYCQVINLLQGYESDERYIEAKEQVELLEEKLGLEKGATKCSQKK
jgi:pSer/pThr/pTyr-binding forkhead associated (FHA) protein